MKSGKHIKVNLLLTVLLLLENILTCIAVLWLNVTNLLADGFSQKYTLSTDRIQHAVD